MNASAQEQLNKEWVTVCNESDLTPNIGVCAKVNNQQVAIFLLQDAQGEKSLYAIDNHDPMSHANVISRGLIGDIKGRLVVASPIYKHHFDLRTGECLEENCQIPVYAARLNEGKVEVAA